MESMNNVEKSLIHISHLHQLKLVASPEPKPICHACNMPCADQSYSCIDCNYFLHITCATIGRSINHPSHPAHTLKFELTPPYPNGHYSCDACGVDGSSFCLRCSDCGYDLHLHCAAITHTVNHHSHRHPLILLYKNPYPPNTTATCDVCNNSLDISKWFYNCNSCDFGAHVGCLFPDKLEVLSPGLQPPHAQPHGATQVCNETDTLQQLEAQLRQARMDGIVANILEESRRTMITNVTGRRYERRWI